MNRSASAKLHLTRVLPASPEKVFAMWITPKSLRTWLCPGDTVVDRVEVDARVGGAYRIDMRTVTGDVVMHTGHYLVMDAPRRLVFTWLSSMTYHQETRVSLEFLPHDDGCQLELIHEALPDQDTFVDHTEGWSSILDKLAGAADQLL